MQKSVISRPNSAHQKSDSRKPRERSKKGKRFVHVFRASAHKGSKTSRKNSIRPDAQVTESRSKQAPKKTGGEAKVSEGFSPPPSVLSQPIAAPSASDATAVGSGAERAQAAALAERLVKSIRVADLGKDRYAVHVCVAGLSHRGSINVELRHEQGELKAILKPEADAIKDAHRLAEAFKSEAAERGLHIESVEVDA